MCWTLYHYLFVFLTYVVAAQTLPASFNDFLQISEDSKEWLVGLRRNIHKHAELAYLEVETSKIIQKELTALGVKFTAGWGRRTLANGTTVGGTAIVAEIGDGKSPCVALRADIDGLPIEELTGLPFASINEGVMHACGHDGHAAILLGAAKILSEEWKRQPWKGTVRLIFQHGEEEGVGAMDLIREGVLSKNPPVQNVFGLHINALKDSGEIGGSSGPAMAGFFGFDIEINGLGGHASAPHMLKDPLTAAANVMANANTIVSRETNSLKINETGVISFTAVDTPQSYNVVPSSVTIKGCIRSLSTDFLDTLASRLEEVAKKTSEGFRCNATFKSSLDSTPPVVNDNTLWKWTTQKLTSNNVGFAEVAPRMVSDDFAYYTLEVPGLYLSLGARPQGVADPFPHHHAEFDLDEAPLVEGATLLAFLAYARLPSLTQ